MNKHILSLCAGAAAFLISASAWSGEVMVGKNGEFAMSLPDGYTYDMLNYYYSSADGKVHVSPSDASFFGDSEDFQESIQNVPGEAKTQQAGANTLIIKEEKEGFYGPSTLYYVDFNGQFKNHAGCMLRFFDFDGLEGTQTQDVVDAVSSVRRYTPFMDFSAAGDIAQTGAMSSFMQQGHYAAAGNIVYGHVFDSKGAVEFARIDLAPKGDSYEVQGHKIIEKGVWPSYISLYGDYVFYIRSGKGIWCALRDGSSPKAVIDDAVEYLQVKGDRMYWCDSNYRLKTVDMTTLVSVIEGKNDLEGGEIDLQENIDTVFDKEIYYAFMLNEDWLIYQDDADHESLHLRHLKTGADTAVTGFPGHGPVMYGTDLYFKAVQGDVETLARIDMSKAEIIFDPDSDAFSITYPVIEYSGKRAPMQLAIDAAGMCYAGLDQGRHISRWKEIENPEGREDTAYKFSGPDFSIAWTLTNGVVNKIRIESKTGAISSIPRLD